MPARTVKGYPVARVSGLLEAWVRSFEPVGGEDWGFDLSPSTERATIRPMRSIIYLVIVLFSFSLLPGAGPVAGAVKKIAKQPVKNTKLKKKIIDKKPPGFLFRPTVSPQNVMTPTNLPVMTFSADEDVSVEVEAWMGNGRQRLTGDVLAAANLKKGKKLNVAWTIATLSDGKFNFHIIMTDKAGNRTKFNAPFTVSFMDNRNRKVIYNEGGQGQGAGN